MSDNCTDGTERCEYAVTVKCDPEVAATVANAWMIFCNTVRSEDGAKITDARADPGGVERLEKNTQVRTHGGDSR